MSHQVTVRLNRYIQSAYPTARVVPRWRTTKACFVSMKDKLSVMRTPNVVYHFQCPCGKGQYVGRTELPLGDRVRQHVPRWLEQGNKERPRSKKPPQSSIARHRLECTTPLENIHSCFKVLHAPKTLFSLKILEALEIKFRKPNLCVQKENLFELKIPWL